MPYVYVILERNAEYNDETYELQDGGNVVVAYMTKEDADKACMKNNIENIRDHGGYQYQSYNPTSNMNNSFELEKILKEISDEFHSYTFEDFDDYYHFEDMMRAIGNLSDDKVAVLINSISEPVFYVQKVEVE